eukprot:gene9312-biopygen9493
MAAPLQPVLWEILREHPEVYIIAYLDDIHILGEPERVREAYDAAVPLLADIGLELNVRKSAGVCEAFQDVVDAGGEPTPGAVVPLQGIRVLGIPVGSETWVADQCFVMASTGGAILPKLARLNDPQVQLLLLRYSIVPILASCTWYGGGVQPHKLMRGALEHDSSIQQCLQKVAGSPYPLGEEAVALSQLPTRWGGLGLTSAQRLAPAGWLGSWAHMWKRVMVMFPVVLGVAPAPWSARGTDARGHPLVAGLVSAMGAVRGARERVLAARAGGHVLPEALKVPEKAPRWESFGHTRPLGATLPLIREVSAIGTGRCRCGGVVDEFGYHYLACNRMGMFTYRHDAVQDVLVEMLRKTPLHTAAVEERRKDALYGDATPHRLVPFAVEAFGGLGEQAKKFLEECAGERQDRLGPELISAMWSTPTFKSYWGQKIMVALHGAQAFGLHSRALTDFPQ